MRLLPQYCQVAQAQSHRYPLFRIWVTFAQRRFHGSTPTGVNRSSAPLDPQRRPRGRPRNTVSVEVPAPRTPAAAASASRLVQETLGSEAAKATELYEAVQGKAIFQTSLSRGAARGEAGLGQKLKAPSTVSAAKKEVKAGNTMSVHQRLAEVIVEVVTASPPASSSAIGWKSLLEQLATDTHGGTSGSWEGELIRAVHAASVEVVTPLNLLHCHYDDLRRAVEANPLYIYAVLLRCLLECEPAVAKGPPHRSRRRRRHHQSRECGVEEVALPLLERVKGAQAASEGGSGLNHVACWYSDVAQSLARSLRRLPRSDSKETDDVSCAENSESTRTRSAIEGLSDDLIATVTAPANHSTASATRLKWTCRHSTNLLQETLCRTTGQQQDTDAKTNAEEWVLGLIVAHTTWVFHALEQHLTSIVVGSTEVVTANCDGRHGSVWQLSLVKNAVDCTEQMWQYAVQPLRVRTSTDTLITHRTVHTSLNLYLAHLQRRAAREQGGQVWAAKDTECVFNNYWRRHPLHAAVLLSVATDLARGLTLSVQTGGLLNVGRIGSKGSRAASSLAALDAVLARTLLDVDVCISLQAAALLGEEWRVPTVPGVTPSGVPFNQLRTSPPTKPTVPVSTPGTDQADNKTADEVWLQVYQQCSALRVGVACFVSEAFRTLTHAELLQHAPTEAHTPPHGPVRRKPSRVLLSMTQSSFFPLLRRHYLMTHGGERVSEVASLRPFRFAGAETALLFRAWLSVFVLASETETPIDERVKVPAANGRGDGGVSGESRANTFSVCGTTLLQSMEVAFFLTLYASSSLAAIPRTVLEAVLTVNGKSVCIPAAAAGGTFTAATVRTYVKEMLYYLDHSTAKQLWFLRRNGTLFYFSGLRQDKTFLTDETVRRRHAQSVLGVVHAHVVHPSLLWMPLWQVQELVFILTHNMDLLYVPQISSSESHQPELKSPSVDDALGGLLGNAVSGLPDDSSSRGDDTPEALPLERATVRVGAEVTDFARVHGYVVLRLFVISNALRTYAALQLDKTPSGAGAATDATASQSALQRVSRYEPAVEGTKRAGRLWAQGMAAVLMTEFPSLAAEAEVTRTRAGGVTQALVRLETTVRTTLTHNLFFNVTKVQRRQRLGVLQDLEPSTAMRDASDYPTPTAESSDGAGGVGAEVQATHSDINAEQKAIITLHLQRNSPTESLGFVLDGASGVLRRVQGDGFFADAAGNAGVRNASSLIGWRVHSVDGQFTEDGRAVIALIKGKLSFRIQLTHSHG